MLVSTLAFVMTVIFLAGIAVMARAARAEKWAQKSPKVAPSRRRRPVDASRLRDVREPSYCYNDCVRAHEFTDPNFPCAVACGARGGTHF